MSTAKKRTEESPEVSISFNINGKSPTKKSVTSGSVSKRKKSTSAQPIKMYEKTRKVESPKKQSPQKGDKTIQDGLKDPNFLQRLSEVESQIRAV